MIERLLQIVGPKGVVDDPADMAPYLVDWKGLKKGRALCVVQPASTEEVAAVVRLAAEEKQPIFPVGGNTGQCFGAIPESGSDEKPGILLSVRRMNKVREVDVASDIITVDAGIILTAVHEAASSVERQFDLHLGSEGSAQIGGLISTNAGGTAVLRHGSMRDLVAGLEVVMPDGRILDDLAALKKDNTGYMLRQLFIGAEGTLGVVTGAALKLNPKLTRSAHAWIAVSSAKKAVELLTLFRERAGSFVEAFEILSESQVELVRLHVPQARIPFEEIPDWSIMVELSAADDGVNLDELLQGTLEVALERDILEDAVIAASEQQAAEIWYVRHAIGDALRDAGIPFALDIGVRTARIPDFIAQADALCAQQFPEAKVVIVGHLGDGNLHYVLLFPKPYWNSLEDKDLLTKQVEHAVHDIAIRLGGTFSAEHGIGRKLRSELARLSDPLRYELMVRVKQALDPENQMNPGVIFA